MTKYAQKIRFCFCRKCGEYHEKTHPYYRAQKQRAYRRRKEAEQQKQSEGARPPSEPTG